MLLTVTVLPKPAKAKGRGLAISCVNTKVSKPRSKNAVPIAPGATVTSSRGVALAELATEIVMRPLEATAVALGTSASMAVASPIKVLLGAAGTATS